MDWQGIELLSKFWFQSVNCFEGVRKMSTVKVKTVSMEVSQLSFHTCKARCWARYLDTYIPIKCTGLSVSGVRKMNAVIV